MAKAKKNSDYWKQRFDQIEQSANNQSVEYIKSLEEKYRKAAQVLDGKINAWYQRLAANNGVSMTEAKKLLNDSELKEFKWTVEEYIKAGEENEIDERWMKELENASAKFHINRMEALKLEARHQIELATGGMVDDVDGLLKNVYTDSFYRSCFEVQKGFGVGFDVSKLDKNKVSKMLSKPWSVDGTNFSEKLWGNKAKLINTLDQELSRMVLTGESPKKVIENIKKAVGTSKNAAGRLVMTEQAYFTSIAQKDAYSELDVEEYEFVGTLDGTTCSDCGNLDGQHFPMSEMQPGINAPPMHPYCRCTTCPYFEDEFTLGKRASRDEKEHTVYKVPEKMTYNEWKKKFVVGGDKDTLSSVELELENIQEYRPIDRSTKASSEVRGNREIKIRRIENSTYNGEIYISDSVQLKPRQMHDIEMSINNSARIVGGNNNLPKCMIISPEEMQTTAVCTYNAERDIMYINAVVVDTKKLLALQRDMACPDNPLSTYVHEFIHWQDALEYRKTSEIISQKEYLKNLRKKCKKKLDRLERKGYNIHNIGEYASKKYAEGKYDETLTEYRVVQLLEKGE